MTYGINAANAISETLDGETIVINLKSGNYYSLNETGSTVWDAIALKQEVDHIIDLLEARYAADRATIQDAVTTFLKNLEGNELIEESSPGDATPIEAHASKKDFVAPTFEMYEDMREMLLADPIHDVAEVGWPNLKEE